MKASYCPRCHGTNLTSYAGGMTGTVLCKDCGYMGTLIIEKEFFKTMDEAPRKMVKK